MFPLRHTSIPPDAEPTRRRSRGPSTRSIVSRKRGAVVEDWPEENYRVASHEIEISGDLRPGRVIHVNLHYSKRDWKLADPVCMLLEPGGAGTTIEMRESCPAVRVVHRSGLDGAASIVAALSLGVTVPTVHGYPSRLGEAT